MPPRRETAGAPAGTLADEVEHTWSIPEALHYNSWIAQRTNALIEKHYEQREPFFIWSSFPNPHPPYLVPAPWDSMYDPRQLTVPAVTPAEHDVNPRHFALTQQVTPDYSAWRETGYSVHGLRSHVRSENDVASW